MAHVTKPAIAQYIYFAIMRRVQPQGDSSRAGTAAPRTRLRLTSELRLVAPDHVQAIGERRRISMTLATANVLSRFATPHTAEEIYGQAGSGVAREPFMALVAELLASGVLTEAGGEDAAAGRSLLEVLRPKVLADPALVKTIGENLRRGRPCIIRDALDPRLAGEVAGALEVTEAWQPYQKDSPFFGYRHHNLYEPSRFPTPLRECQRIFDHPRSRALAGELSGRDCAGPVQLSASLYMPGDGSQPHDDASSLRTVAFTWHLTRAWQPSWGGHFFWCAPPTAVVPSFNTLILFVVEQQKSFHFVQTVSAVAQGRRLAVNGWWTAQQADPAVQSSRRQRESAWIWPGGEVLELGEGIFRI